MKPIELTDDEIKVLHQHLNGEFGQFNATDYQIKHFSSVIDKADEYFDEYAEQVGDETAWEERKAYDALDLILWFYDKYKEQQKE